MWRSGPAAILLPITGILVAVLVAGGLFVIVAFVLIGAGMCRWASDK
jgi:hypothetical protein